MCSKSSRPRNKRRVCDRPYDINSASSFHQRAVCILVAFSPPQYSSEERQLTHRDRGHLCASPPLTMAMPKRCGSETGHGDKG